MRELVKLSPLSSDLWGERIAFYGPICSGKTYCASYLADTFGYTKFSLASRLKYVVQELFGPSPKNAERRDQLQKIGAIARTYDPDVWTKLMLEDINDELESWGHNIRIVVDDVRYKNEADILKAQGFILAEVRTSLPVRLERFNTFYPDSDFDKVSSHHSEQNFDSIMPDVTVLSDTSEVEKALDHLADRTSWSI